MLWGLGYGRCGTGSLAKKLEAAHEPKPWLRNLPMRWLHGEEEVTDELKDVLFERLLLGASVDLKYSLVLPLIKEMDPDPEFHVVFREPELTIKSFLDTGGWTESDWFGTRRWFPKSGWQKWRTPHEKGIISWNNTYLLIMKELENQKKVYWYHAEDLPAHVNSHGTKPWGEEKWIPQLIRNDCSNVYRKLLDLRNSNT